MADNSAPKRRGALIDGCLDRRPIGRLGRVFASFVCMTVLAQPLAACISMSDPPIFTRAVAESQNETERDQLVAMFGGAYKADDALVETITQITGRIVKASDDPNAHYRLTILNSPGINAFALPSGDIFITRGLIALANDTSELGAVIAHEIAHVTARHASRRAEFEKSAHSIPDEIGADESTMTGDGNRFKLASFSRTQEIEADEIGIKTLARAGYDPYGASRFLLALNRSTALDGSPMSKRKARASFLSSHPSTPQRLSVAIDMAAAYAGPKSTEADRQLYLMALNKLTFGDDPAAGVIDGRRFYHPALDFTFQVPEEFQIENSPQAVIGMTAARENAMRLDTVVGASADGSLASGWIEGARLDAVVPLDVGNLHAFTATAYDGEWHYRLAAIEKDGKVFRMIFAARILTPDIDQQFLASIRSFRRMTSEEKDLVKPLELAIARAESGDTVDTMAARMAGVTRAQELFRLLNGVDRAELKDGVLYKIIVPK